MKTKVKSPHPVWTMKYNNRYRRAVCFQIKNCSQHHYGPDSQQEDIPPADHGEYYEREVEISK